MSHVIKLVNIILVDLLPAGTFSRHTDEQRKRLEGAALTNLKSERDFGSYDYSMKKRPNATIHYHSSILLIKAHRVGVMRWLQNLPLRERRQYMRKVCQIFAMP